jgi:GNAT superfamily N-acetyltransferase
LIRVPMPAVDVEIHQIKATDDNDLEMLVKFGKYGSSKALLLRRFAEGQRCYVAKSEGRIVSGNWVFEKEWKQDDLGRQFKLADNELYYDGAFTLPEFRGKGIMPYLKTQSISDMKTHSQHKTRALAFILVSNKASLRSTAKVGFERVGRVGWIEILGIRVHYLLGRNVLPETTQRFFIERN